MALLNQTEAAIPEFISVRAYRVAHPIASTKTTDNSARIRVSAEQYKFLLDERLREIGSDQEASCIASAWVADEYCIAMGAAR